MDINELVKRQKQLQNEGKEVLNMLGIIEFLSQFGHPEVVGSMVTELMTWPDIDIELVKEINEEEYWKTVKHIFHKPGFKRVLAMDFRKSTNHNTPKGLHICVMDYGYKSETWKIDIWFIPPRDPNDENFHEWMKNNLKEEHRLSILEIKRAISSNPKYRNEIFSIDIYKAVIEKGVRNVNEFEKYLKEMNKSLN